MNDSAKPWIILLTSFLTLFMLPIIPVGGGVSLILVISVPALIGLGIIFAITYHFISKTINSLITKKCIYFLMIMVLIVVSLCLYPYDI